MAVLSTGIQSWRGNGAPLHATTLRDEAFRAIRRAILAGRLAPGSRLVEADLAASLGVSRNPIREAITRLEQQGLVVSIPNRGAFITQPSPEQAHDMFLLRAHLEHLAVRLALGCSDPRIFDPAAEVVDEMMRLVHGAPGPDSDVLGEFSVLDTEFHTRLVIASGSPALLRAWETAAPTDIIFLYDRTRMEALNTTELQAMAGRHATLLDALHSGDPTVAQTELRTHFMAVSRDGTVSLDERSLAMLDWTQSSPLAGMAR